MPIEPAGLLDLHRHAGIACEQRHLVGGRGFQPVDLALLQGRDCGSGIAERQPLDAIEMRHLGAGGVALGSPAARHITGEPLVGRALPGTNSEATKRYGPLPTISVTWWNGSVLARRSGMMHGIVPSEPASAAGKMWKRLGQAEPHRAIVRCG